MKSIFELIYSQLLGFLFLKVGRNLSQTFSSPNNSCQRLSLPKKDLKSSQSQNRVSQTQTSRQQCAIQDQILSKLRSKPPLLFIYWRYYLLALLFLKTAQQLVLLWSLFLVVLKLLNPISFCISSSSGQPSASAMSSYACQGSYSACQGFERDVSLFGILLCYIVSGFQRCFLSPDRERLLDQSEASSCIWANLASLCCRSCSFLCWLQLFCPDQLIVSQKRLQHTNQSENIFVPPLELILADLLRAVHFLYVAFQGVQVELVKLEQLAEVLQLVAISLLLQVAALVLLLQLFSVALVLQLVALVLAQHLPPFALLLTQLKQRLFFAIQIHLYLALLQQVCLIEISLEGQGFRDFCFEQLLQLLKPQLIFNAVSLHALTPLQPKQILNCLLPLRACIFSINAYSTFGSYSTFVAKLGKLILAMLQLDLQGIPLISEAIDFTHEQRQDTLDFSLASANAIHLSYDLFNIVLLIADQLDHLAGLCIWWLQSRVFLWKRLAISAASEVAVGQLEGVRPGLEIGGEGQL